MRKTFTTQGTEAHRGFHRGRYEFGLDGVGDLGSRSGALGNYWRERSAAKAVASERTAGRGSALCAPDFLCALDLYRHRAGTVCGALLWVREGFGWGECAGAVSEWIYRGVLVVAGGAATFLLRPQGAERKPGDGHALCGIARGAGCGVWGGGDEMTVKNPALPHKLREGWGSPDEGRWL